MLWFKKRKIKKEDASCRNCGYPKQDDSIYCPKCGYMYEGGGQILGFNVTGNINQTVYGPPFEENTAETAGNSNGLNPDIRSVSQPLEIILYKTNNLYEDEEVKIVIRPEEIRLYEYTYEHAPGGTYGLTHVLDKKNAETFLESLHTTEENLTAVITDKFSGEDGVRKFKAYCKELRIEFDSYA